MKRLILAILAATNCSCVPHVAPGEIENRKIFQETDYRYELVIPSILSRWTTHSERMDSPSLPRFTSEIKDNWTPPSIDANIYHNISCPSLGISERMEMQFQGGKGTWAKMPINRGNDDILFCMPPYTETCTKEAYWTSGCNDGTAAYAFCAEKNGKAVAICIQQMTDDETLAKEIFESFRWTN